MPYKIVAVALENGQERLQPRRVNGAPDKRQNGFRSSSPGFNFPVFPASRFPTE
jgi:hypothetical protein